MRAVRILRTLGPPGAGELIGLGVAAAVVLVAGTEGFLRSPGAGLPGGLVNAFYRSVQLFGLNFPDAISPVWELQIARFLAPLIISYVALRALAAILGSQVERLHAQGARDHVVVLGLGRRGRRLVEVFREGGHRVVAVERDPGLATVDGCRALGASVVVGDASDPVLLRRLGVGRARHVFAVCSDDETNLEIAAALARLDEDGAGSRNAVILVRQESLWRALQERAPQPAAGPTVGLEFVNTPQRAATALLRRQPPWVGSPRTAGVVVVGTGELARAVVVRAARLWDTLGGPTPGLRITLVNPAAHEEASRLCLRHPPLGRGDRLEVVPIAPDSVGFERADFLSHRSGPSAPSAVYVCLEQEGAALAAGLALRERLHGAEIPVVVAVPSEKESAGRFLAEAQPASTHGLRIFGVLEETCTPELLLDNFTETMARRLHERYLRHQARAGAAAGRQPHLVPWDELSEFARESNRALAADIRHKLRVVGCDWRLLDDWGDHTIAFDEDEVERLAREEHERWRGFMERGHYRPGPRSENPRQHPDLVDWGKLPEGAREINGP